MTGETFESPDWYRIADSRPTLRGDVDLRLHFYQGRPWYVLADSTGGKVHRLTPAAHAVVGRLDGRRSLDEIWREVVTELGEDGPSQGDIVRLVSQLHSADLLKGLDRPLLDDLVERRDKDRLQPLKKLFLNPLSATVPLVDPDRFLAVLVRGTRIVPAWAWWLATAMIIACALGLTVANWDALSQRGLDGILDVENLVLIALVYPVVKALHEIGHGIAIRSRHGEVHEMGLMFIVFYPIPYVEASASMAFPSKWARAAVAAAGVAVELVIASLALFVWLVVEPGMVRSVAYNVMLIAGFSTLLVNGNPLLRFDGYHVLCDIIEIPNLGKRGNEWWGEILRVHLLGTREKDRLPVTAWERGWFLVYPPAAYAYRIVIAITIALFVATTYRIAGVLLALWSLALTVVWPAMKVVRKTWTDERIRSAGWRAGFAGIASASAVGALLLFIPIPHNVITEGVVWLPRDAFVRAEASGMIGEVQRGNGSNLRKGDVIATLDAPERAASLAVAEARLRRAEVALAAARFTDRAAAVGLESEVADAAVQVVEERRRTAGLTVAAALDGTLETGLMQDIEGRFVREGDLVAYALPDAPLTIRAVLRQSEAAYVEGRLTGVSVRFADRLDVVHRATVLRQVPAGEVSLPSPVLSIDGGGRIATTSDGQGGFSAAERLFQFDLVLEGGTRVAEPFGIRAVVRLELEPMPAAMQIAMRFRQLLLSAFDV